MVVFDGARVACDPSVGHDKGVVGVRRNLIAVEPVEEFARAGTGYKEVITA